MMGKIDFNKAGDVAGIKTARQNEAKKADAETSVGESSKTLEKDRLQVSSQASRVGKLVDKIKDLPDVRAEKVNDLRERIETGNYNPSSEDIAAAILKEESR